MLRSCTRARLEEAHWAQMGGAGAVGALCACVLAGGAQAQHAHHVLLVTARSSPPLRAPLLTALLQMDAHAHTHGHYILCYITFFLVIVKYYF